MPERAFREDESRRLSLGFGERPAARLVMKREANGWRLDDLFATPDFPQGLKRKLRETIAEDSRR